MAFRFVIMKYKIEVNENQLSMLEYACEFIARTRMGQLDLSGLQCICEEMWCKQHKKKVGDPEWYDMREKLEQTLNDIKWDCWGFYKGQSGGVHFDSRADAFWDMYQCLRHARYLSFDENDKELMRHTVMADKPMQFGDEPLIKVERKDD